MNLIEASAEPYKDFKRPHMRHWIIGIKIDDPAGFPKEKCLIFIFWIEERRTSYYEKVTYEDLCATDYELRDG